MLDDIPALKIKSITIDNTPINCKVGEINTATATISPHNAYSHELSWSSSDETILYIDEFSGMYIGLAEGTATITATATDGSGVSASAIVYVTEDSGIDNVYIDSKSDVIYDIYGRKLLTPTKGINIINGKKILVR